ncbi:lipase [Xanthomonas phaseoli pv. phaseoli]|uniref:Lipase n=1 Tax=Xanthomonas campestris pv. glycines TaxID=473421 RepID=A0AAX0HUN5_XANCG|nr:MULTISPECIES: lipase family protein [Xanthomonas]AOY64557.1 alpha/beta hydrolase [Xanthomonas citri pv. glycines str. 8ra]ARV21552.1 lipase [Xanthomonas citri pv. glycines str. 12-2]EWC49506.1 lipase [Xanthomonas citri pv. glycines str. 8ra]KGU56444.1 lipase [Xanthomonas phaseoli pv. phaseoli]KHF49121.1 lipase [Xanthomonas phaseoli pv. phaseoli]
MLQINSRSAFGLAAMLGIASAVLAPGAQAAPARGALITSNFLTSYTRDAIGAMLASEPQAEQPKCNVRVAEFTYATVGVEGEPATASGVLLIPDGERCAGPYPLLGWGRPTGTVRAEEQAKDIRDAKGNDPLVTRLASQGYVVVSSDYLGFGPSNYPYHPYLHSATEASATIDAMRAARSVLQRLNTPLSGKVMLSGYSQGGHTAMATQREIEAHLSKEFHLVASAPISGPYALQQTFLDSWSGSNAVGESSFGIILGSYAIVAMQHTYKNIYLEPGQVFQDPWAAKVEPLFPGKQSLTDLFLGDTLPGIDRLKAYFQPGFYRDFASNPANPFRQDLARNDLLAWAPQTPTLLCGSSNDATIPLKNAQTAIASFKRRGSNQVAVVDIGTGNSSDNSAFVHLLTNEPCIVAVRHQLLDKQR